MTTPMPPFGDPNNDFTRPMPDSPYGFDTGNPPPPPPIWGEPAAPPVLPGQTHSSAWILAVLLLVVGSVMIFGVANAASFAAFFNTLSQHTSVPVASVITATPQPTATVTATATSSPPTATVPTVPDGYTTYTASDNSWSMNVPNQAESNTGTAAIAGVDMNEVQFSLRGHQTLTAFVSNSVIDVSNLQLVFDDLINVTHATGPQLIQQPYASTLGNYQWYLVKYQAHSKGQTITCSFAIANSAQSTVIILFQSPPDSYSNDANTIYTPALQSFAFASN